MELGQRIKAARLEAGLSQRQLCADTITRNMLSQIENGSAKPSMTTLTVLAQRLGKPVGYFLNDGDFSQRALLEQARNAPPEEALTLLQNCTTPPADQEYPLLLALTYQRLAEKALEQRKTGYALSLLEKAAQAGESSAYFDALLLRRQIILEYRAKPESASTLAGRLPDNTDELLLRAHAALDTGHPDRCIGILDGAPTQNAYWHFLRAEAFLVKRDFLQAARHFHKAEDTAPRKVYGRLEQCYRELKDFEKAYYYACKQR